MIWVCWSFGAVTLGAAAWAALAPDIRRAVLALWVAGLAAGGLYLTLGSELLAIVQWIVSTVTAISFLFFSVVFGQFRAVERPGRWARTGLAALAGFAVAALLGWAAVRMGHDPAPEEVTRLVPGSDLVSLGKVFTGEHFLSLEILGVLMFMVLVGAGVLARPDRAGPKGDNAEVGE
jgi:NADH:ubiquinone oxidoreductase subunit 6 (subunit J)